MACCMKNMGKGHVRTKKTLLCSWLVMLLLLSSEEMGSDGCQGQESKNWSGNMCIEQGTCNVPCRQEGFDYGSCEALTLCVCYTLQVWPDAPTTACNPDDLMLGPSA
uniref:Uncharacterized protein n=1 Tax=Avena sativa TaxID=4498 RepID=A0ACD5TSP6_AVESA